MRAKNAIKLLEKLINAPPQTLSRKRSQAKIDRLKEMKEERKQKRNALKEKKRNKAKGSKRLNVFLSLLQKQFGEMGESDFRHFIFQIQEGKFPSLILRSVRFGARYRG